MKKIGIYYRVSTDRQDLESQKLVIEQWLADLPENKKPKSIETYEDEGISGKTLQRPGLKRMMDDAHGKKIDTIVCFRLDRFSRNASSAIRMILTLDEIGVGFISVTQPVLNLGLENPFRRTILAAFAEIAEIERETIIMRVNAGIQAAKKRGVVLGQPKKLDDEKMETIKQLRQDGKKVREIAKIVGLSLGTISKAIQEKESERCEAGLHPT